MPSEHFLLLPSPLAARATFPPLLASLLPRGASASVVEMDNHPPAGSPWFRHHIGQIEAALAELSGRDVVAVAHSGAGNLLALLDPARFNGHVFLDAIFPLAAASRFALFDDVVVADQWRTLAQQHDGVIPRAMLQRFGGQISHAQARAAFAAAISDVPVGVYEETIPVHREWPAAVSRGLFVHWTKGYTEDAARAATAGFAVRLTEQSHFHMLNAPDEVADVLLQFVDGGA